LKAYALLEPAILTLLQMYHLPLLPGYGPNANVRSSAPPLVKKGKAFMDRLLEAEENGYQGTYFPPQADSPSDLHRGEGYISSSSPIQSRAVQRPKDDHMPETDVETEVEQSGFATEPETPFLEVPSGANVEVDPGAETDPGIYSKWKSPAETPDAALPSRREEEVGEVVFFEYGVVVFFGLSEQQERDILEDVDHAGIMKRKIEADDWEIEECHFTHDPFIAYPRIYNDFFSEFPISYI
jgi:uncharacterized Rmd1/YagE family protein